MSRNNRTRLRKNAVRVLALVLAALLVGGAVFSGVIAAFSEGEADRAEYDVRMRQIDAATWQISCGISYTNTTGKSLTGVLFAVYANQLRRESALVAEASELEAVFPGGYAPGGVEFSEITVNGQPADWGMQGAEEEFVRVGCALAPGETAVFRFEYALLIIRSRGTIGFSEDDIRLTGFLPGLAVWDGDAFFVNAASPIARYAYHEPADYHVELEALDWYDVAAPGRAEAGKAANGLRAWTIEAKAVREFALTLSAKYRTREVTSKLGTRILLKGSSRLGLAGAARTAQAAIDALEEWFGASPYPEITIAEADLVSEPACFGGLIWIPRDRFERDRTALERDVVTGLAEQFFGMGAGNDPVQAPWISTAVPRFVYYLFVEREQGRDAMLSAVNRDCLASLLVTIPGAYEVDAALTAFRSRSDFQTIVRDRGAAALYQIREDMGEETFIDGLANFYQTWNGKTAGLREFVQSFNAVGDREYDLLIVDWFYTIDEYQGQIIDWFQ